MAMNVLGIPNLESTHPDRFYMIVFAFNAGAEWHLSQFVTVNGDPLTVPVYGYERSEVGWVVNICQNHDTVTDQVNTFRINITDGSVDFSYKYAACPLQMSPPGIDSK